MSIVSEGLAWAAGQRKAYAAETGVIRRDVSRTDDVSMTIGKTMADVDGGGGITVRTNICDILIDAADYQFDGQVVEPKRGDQFDYAGKAYQAMPIATGEVWRYCENVNRTTLRIHTKEVGDAS